MIKKYFNFRLFSLLESILVVNPDFFNILDNIADKGDFVAQSILKLVNNDIKTNVNYLKPSDKNDDVNFINDTQVKRHIDAGKKDSDIFSMSANTAKIGRTVRQILKSNGISFTDAQIEKFVNLYKNSWDKKYSKFEEGFSLIKGEAIRDWYLEDNYVPGGGTLNSSCMRYSKTQDFLDIYTENPEVCQLLILVDDSNRLLGRALLWKLVEGTGKSPYYLDRAYTRYDSDHEKFADWFKDFIKSDDDFSAHFVGYSGCRVKLKKWKFEQYPYMDTFAVLGFESGVLKTRRESNEIEAILQSTGGEYSVPNHVWSEYHGIWINTVDSLYINGDYFLRSECVQDYENQWILKDESVWSDYYDAYINKEHVVDLEGFGKVSEYDIITVYDDLTEEGVPMSPRKYLKSKINNDYVKIQIDGGNVYLNRKFMIYDLSEANWILNLKINDDMKILYDVNDIYTSMVNSMDLNKVEIYNYVYCKKHVFLKHSEEDLIVSYIPFIVYLQKYDGYNHYFASEESLKCFNTGIDIDTLEKFIISKNEYYRDFKRVIDAEYDKQLEGVNNFEYKVEELKQSINYIDNNSTFKKNNDLYKISKSVSNFTKTLNEELADEFASEGFSISDLYNKSDIDVLLSTIKENEPDYNFSYIDSDGNLVKFLYSNFRDGLEVSALIEFIREYEYYILLYVYIYIIEYNNRNIANSKIFDILKKDNKYDSGLGDIFSLFTYNDTFPSFSRFITSNYRSGFEKRSIFKILTADDYKKGFDFFYKRLKSLKDKKQ